MVSQFNGSLQVPSAIECKVKILQLLQLQREIECVRSYESEDDDDYDGQDDDDDFEKEEPIVEKDESPRRYRTSEFPLFSQSFWDISSQGHGATRPSISSLSEKEDIDPVRKVHEGPKGPWDRQPNKLGTTLTSDVIGDTVMGFLEKGKMDMMLTDIGGSNTSITKYRGGIPIPNRIHQKSLPPIGKRQESHVTTRQKLMPAIEKRKKPKTAKTFESTKKDKADKSGPTVEAMPRLVRDPSMLSNKPCLQGVPYGAKPFKLLPPIVTKTGGKTNARDKILSGDHQMKGNSNPIKVRHTKKSAQMERKAKAKREAEKEVKRKALANVKQPLVKVPVSSASKPKGTASYATDPDWSAPKHKKGILPMALPPIRKLKETSNDTTAKSDSIAEFSPSNASTVIGVRSVVAAMSEKIDPTKYPIKDKHTPRSSRSSISRSYDFKRSQRDHRSRSPKSSRSCSARSEISTHVSTRPLKSESKSSRDSPPCSSSRNHLAVRSTSPHDVRKSARLSTPGSRKYTNGDDTSQRCRQPSPCISGRSKCLSRRSRRDRKPRSSSPLIKSGRSSHPGSPKMKDTSDGNPPDNESEYSQSTARLPVHTGRSPSISPDTAQSTARSSVHTGRSPSISPDTVQSTARSSVHTGRSPSISPDTAGTHSSASLASRNTPRLTSTTSSKVPTQRPTSERVASKDGTTSQNIPNRPYTAPARQSVAPPHPNTPSSYPSSARHSAITVRPNTASLLRQKSVSSRQSIASKRQYTDSVHRDTVFSRQNITPVRHTTAPVRLTHPLARPTTAPARPTPGLARPTTAPARPTTAPTRPTTAPARPTSGLARPTTITITMPDRPTTAHICRSTTPSRQSIPTRSKIAVRIATSARSDSVNESRNNTAVLKTPLDVPY